MTSIEWLIKELYTEMNMSGDGRVLDEILEEAKEMQRQEHSKTWDEALRIFEARGHNFVRAWEDFDDYYQETFVSKGSDTLKDYHIVDTNEMVDVPQQEISDEAQRIIGEHSIQILEISDEEIEKFISTFPYTKHLDDGQYNDGVIVGIELGIEWYREQLKKKQNGTI
jgi:vacuolar-type H+-ATPase subunit H